MNEEKNVLSREQILNCINILEQLNENSNNILQLTEKEKIRLLKGAGILSRPIRKELDERRRTAKKNRKDLAKQKNKLAREATGIRKARTKEIFIAPNQLTCNDSKTIEEELTHPRNCYVCKEEYTKLHFFYDTMCKKCGDFNYHKRFQTASLHGQVALITGSRVKIGFQATLMMLRAGARVIATTRFPADSAIRYSKEKDYSQWKDRLHIYGLDLRHTPSVELFANYIEQNYDRLDILINNAAQTVRRPSGFYTHLMENENKNIHELPEKTKILLENYTFLKSHLSNLPRDEEKSSLPVLLHGKTPGVGVTNSAQLSQIPYSFDEKFNVKEVFPEGKLDVDLQQVDLRKTNSWRLVLGEVHPAEMLEVQLVNAVAPFVLSNRLVNLMKKDFTGQKHIVNVTAMEGKFYKFKQAPRHPHTNMAKAALNMLTHTSATELAKAGIYVNAVDTGWVTDEDPIQLLKHKQDVHDFQPPLDIVDGAARVCDPFFDGILTDKHWVGKFLKDYFPIDW